MFANMREMWDEASAGARAGLVIGVLLIIALVAWLSLSVLRPEYQVLFSDLDPQDASTMVAELDKMKVPYRLGADGTTILVDKAQVHPLRLKLLGKGGTPLRGGVGFEIFNNTDFGMTEFAQKINYQRALQGELTRTITSLDEVKSARVHLVLPESGLFRKSGMKPKASITLAMKDGRSLAPEQVLGIQRLVAAAVPEIEPSAVTIADQRGVTLTRASGGDDDAPAARLGIKSDVEAYFARKLVVLFDRAFGPGRVIVSVDATINHDQVKVTREDVLPLGMRGGEAVGAVARSRTTQAEPAAAGTGAGAGGEAAKTGSSSSEVEYLNGRRIEQVISMPGSIKRLSVGIVLPKAMAMDKARLDEIRQLVASTVGINPSRGDEIAISSLDMSAARANAEAMAKPPSGSLEPLPPAMQSEAAPSRMAELQFRPEWLAAAVVALVLLLALMFAVASAAGRRRGATARPLTPEARDEALARVRAWMRRDSARGPLRGEGRQP